jgi:peptidylprolyl isomerase
VSNSVKDRQPGQPMLSKAERRALGKARAAKRAVQRRRKAMRDRVLRFTWPVAIVAVLAGLTWWAIDSQSVSTPSADATAAPSAEASSAPAPSLPPGADPQLGIKPEVATPSGTVSALNVTTLITGTGAPVANGQKITVNYTGVAFDTGQEFDSSWKAGGAPFPFTLGQGGVIKGWDEGLVGVTVGSRVQLDIPADLAYGDSPQAGYPAGALRFVVDILSAT